MTGQWNILEASLSDWDSKGSIFDPESLVGGDRKSTRLNSSHLVISYAVFCLKKKTRSFPKTCESRHTCETLTPTTTSTTPAGSSSAHTPFGSSSLMSTQSLKSYSELFRSAR